MFSKGAALACALGFYFHASGESFTTNIVDGFATNILGTFTLGDTGPYNFFLVTNGGALTDDQAYIGNTIEAHSNLGVVIGAGSVWSNNQALYIGRVSPSNAVHVLGGGTLSVGNALGIGSAATSADNVLHVTGADSLLTGVFLYVGTYGARNQFVVEDGARARLSALIFNSEQSTNGGRNRALFANAGTFVTVAGSLQLGNAPANRLLISKGARLETSQATVGSHLYSPSNRVELLGSGSYWINSNTLVFGTSGSSNNAILILAGTTLQTKNIAAGTSGNLITVDGGNLVTGSLQLGLDPNTFGDRLEVLNPGSHLSQTQTFNIGNYGSRNSFVLSNGARADLGTAIIGAQSVSSNNSALATGAGTLWVSDGLEVGSAGNNNQLTISNGARVYTGRLIHGTVRGRGNITRVTGLNSLLSVTNAIDLGWRNMLEVGALARVESGSGIIGNHSYDSNTALLSGASWSNAAGLTIGSDGDANFLAVSNNSRLDCTDVAIGLGTEARRNRAEISGTTLWNVRSNLSVGVLGDSNQLSINQGAAVFARNVFVAAHDLIQAPPPTANFSSDYNSLTVDGTNTTLSAMANLFIGNHGRSNQLVVSGGAQVTVTNDVFVGYRGNSNRLELRSGARLNSSSLALGWHSNAAHNFVLVDSGARLTSTGLTVGAEGYGGTLLVSNGAILQNRDAVIGSNGIALGPVGGCSNRFGFNQVVISGTGSVWRSSGRMTIGYNSTSNSINVTSGGTLHANDISIVGDFPLCGPALLENRLTVEGGTFIVTNRIYITRGRFRMLSGQSTIASLFVEGGPPGRCEIVGGTLRCPSLYASGPAEIRIGDGAHRAVWQIDGGSVFSSGGITIASNSVVAGRGSISGAITNFGIFGTLSAVSDITNGPPVMPPSSGMDVWIQQVGPGTGHTVLRFSPPPLMTPALDGRLRVALSRAWQPSSTDEFPVVMFPSATGAFVNAPHNSRIKTIDNLASFLVLYRSNAVVLTDYRSSDLDGDGIEDAWANTYFGHSPLTSAEKLTDSDGDGASNLSEFTAGTDPTDAASALRVRAIFANGAATLEWPSVDGKSYRVFFSRDMRTWREVREPTFAFPQPGVCRWTDDGQSTGNPGAGMRFYRVAVE